VQRADQPRTAQPRPEQPRVESRPPAAASEAPAPVVRPIQPRSLYGASRRKLNASELNKRPKAE
jgi:hypothetical protein